MRNICQNLNTGIITNKFLTSKMQSRNRLHFVLTKNTPENRSVNCIKIISLRTVGAFGKYAGGIFLASTATAVL